MSGQRPDLQGKLKVRHFEKLAELRDQLPKTSSSSDAPRRSPPPPPEPRPERESQPPRPGGNAAQTFEQAMEGVVPLNEKRRVQGPTREINPEVMDEIAQVNAYLRDLVDGVLPFDFADTDEYIEGSVKGLDRRLVRKLKRGEYSIQNHIDLHGFNREEARIVVAKFIKTSHSRGLRCVLVVHGRGLRSKDQMPVLKEKLKAWLTRGSIGTKVLAFTSAQSYDGGTGAIYVLLRR